jgi:hypothetical protein
MKLETERELNLALALSDLTNRWQAFIDIQPRDQLKFRAVSSHATGHVLKGLSSDGSSDAPVLLQVGLIGLCHSSPFFLEARQSEGDQLLERLVWTIDEKSRHVWLVFSPVRENYSPDMEEIDSLWYLDSPLPPLAGCRSELSPNLPALQAMIRDRSMKDAIMHGVFEPALSKQSHGGSRFSPGSLAGMIEADLRRGSERASEVIRGLKRSAERTREQFAEKVRVRDVKRQAELEWLWRSEPDDSSS